MARNQRNPNRPYHWQTAKDGTWAKLEPEAVRMRRAPTPAEGLLWSHLRKGQLGVRFRREHAIDRFIVDFCCLPRRLVVEVDGPIHANQTDHDAERAAHLASAGFRVLRFQNHEVEQDTDRVLAAIRDAINDAI